MACTVSLRAGYAAFWELPSGGRARFGSWARLQEKQFLTDIPSRTTLSGWSAWSGCLLHYRVVWLIHPASTRADCPCLYLITPSYRVAGVSSSGSIWLLPEGLQCWYEWSWVRTKTGRNAWRVYASLHKWLAKYKALHDRCLLKSWADTNFQYSNRGISENTCNTGTWLSV